MQTANAPQRRMIARTPKRGARLKFGDPVYFEVMDFLIQEARLLDENELMAWVDLLSEDIFYAMPVRRTVARKDGAGFDPMQWMYDNYASLKFRALRNATSENAFAEDPPSRIRRYVSNLTLYATEAPDEFVAQSYLLLQRNRGDMENYETISCLRDDILRRAGADWKIAQRQVMIDQAVLGTRNITFFI